LDDNFSVGLCFGKTKSDSLGRSMEQNTGTWVSVLIVSWVLCFGVLSSAVSNCCLKLSLFVFPTQRPTEKLSSKCQPHHMSTTQGSGPKKTPPPTCLRWALVAIDVATVTRQLSVRLWQSLFRQKIGLFDEFWA
jgi:hypothetical protein